MKRRTFLGAVSGAATLATLGGAVPIGRERLTGWKAELDFRLRKAMSAFGRDLLRGISVVVPIGYMPPSRRLHLHGAVNASGFGVVRPERLKFVQFYHLSIDGRPVSLARFCYSHEPWEGIPATDFDVIPESEPHF
jgi:hypothetical protein